MLKELWQQWKEDFQTRSIEIGGLPYAPSNLKRIDKPEPTPLALRSLTGLVDFILASNPAVESEVLIHIEDQARVVLVDRKLDEIGRRSVRARAVYDSSNDFKFGEFYGPEEFIIALRTNFILVDGDDLTYVLKLASGLQAELVATSDDDGLSQTAAIRKGVTLKEKVAIKPTVELQPFRTFIEAEQPKSRFLLRLRSDEPGELPECALFPADGKAWKNAAMANIAKWLREQLGENYTIIC
jgi:hypothetical protein